MGRIGMLRGDQWQWPPAQVAWVGYANYMPVALYLSQALREAGISWYEGVPAQINASLQTGNSLAVLSSSVTEVLMEGLQPLMDYGVGCEGQVGSVYLGMVAPPPGLEDFVLSLQSNLAREYRLDPAAGLTIAQLHELGAAWAGCYSGTMPWLHLGRVSQSSAMLARILYELWFGGRSSAVIPAEWTVSETDHRVRLGGAHMGPGSWRPGRFYVMIGDDAMRCHKMFDLAIDLSQAWQDLTRLPFVFARWLTPAAYATHPQLPVVRSALQQAVAAADQLVASLPPGVAGGEVVAARLAHMSPPTPYYDERLLREVDLVSYWRRISYHIGPRAQQSCELFLALARELASGGHRMA